jgi:hypothetical protein
MGPNKGPIKHLPPVRQISIQTRVYSCRFEKANKRQHRRLPPRFLPAAAAAPSLRQARQDEARQVTPPVFVRPLLGLASLYPSSPLRLLRTSPILVLIFGASPQVPYEAEQWDGHHRAQERHGCTRHHHRYASTLTSSGAAGKPLNFLRSEEASNFKVFYTMRVCLLPEDVFSSI